ncbi:MAG TPA: hypothetical protein VHF50_07225 [Solirubrobacterales bacterium]|nr:hypothetical protein [Solirubrobacterales bacterium]
MLRNLKALGLALVAMLALGAFMAAAASAKEEGEIVSQLNTTTLTPSLVTATDAGQATGLEFTAFGNSTSCALNEFHGSLPTGTATSLTVATAFGGPSQAGQNCEAGGFPATVTNNGCHLTFTTFQTVAGQPTTWTSNVDLVCPAGVPGIQVHAYSSSTHGSSVCTITVPPQNGITKVTAHNNVKTPTAAHDLTITAEATNITATRSGFCVFDGQGSHTSSAQMHGEVGASARTAQGAPLDLYIRHHPKA